jgi:hypothetical protein
VCWHYQDHNIINIVNKDVDIINNDYEAVVYDIPTPKPVANPNEQQVYWLFGSKPKRKTRRTIRIWLNCIISIALIIDLYFIRINLNHICIFTVHCLVINIPIIKPGKNDWLTGGWGCI